MKIFSELKRVTKILNTFPNHWAICGGVAASIYRTEPRFTNDIDIALIDSSSMSAVEIAKNVITKLGYQEYLGFIPDPANPKKQMQGLICGRSNSQEKFIGFDFLLPVQYWVKEAVLLAQKNKLDYGFAKLPTLTPESLIFAKLIALNNNFERFQDMDDISKILSTANINVDYINQEIKNSKIKFKPKVINFFSKHLKV